MITYRENEVAIPIELWESLKNDDYFRELIEILEDRDALISSVKEEQEYYDFESYDRDRRKESDV